MFCWQQKPDHGNSPFSKPNSSIKSTPGFYTQSCTRPVSFNFRDNLNTSFSLKWLKGKDENQAGDIRGGSYSFIGTRWGYKVGPCLVLSNKMNNDMGLGKTDLEKI
jgi:hypothetical protein